MFTRVSGAINRARDSKSIIQSEDMAALFSSRERKRGRKTKSKLLEE